MFNLLYLITKYANIIIVIIVNGIRYGFIISLPLICDISSIDISSAFISVPYFSFNFVTNSDFCSSVISVVVILTASL